MILVGSKALRDAFVVVTCPQPRHPVCFLGGSEQAGAEVWDTARKRPHASGVRQAPACCFRCLSLSWMTKKINPVIVNVESVVLVTTLRIPPDKNKFIYTLK